VPDADGIAGLLEDPEDVLGAVPEEIARVGVPPPLDPVHGPASVGVEKAPQELPGISTNQLSLPVAQDDGALVLLPGPMLREEAGPVLPPGTDLHAAGLGDRACPGPPPADPLQRAGGEADQVGVAGVLHDAEDRRARLLDDVTVTEVQAE
jgi:hypothetical protein